MSAVDAKKTHFAVFSSLDRHWIQKLCQSVSNTARASPRVLSFSVFKSCSRNDRAAKACRQDLHTEDTGHRNIAIGDRALYDANYDGNGYNVAIGHDA